MTEYPANIEQPRIIELPRIQDVRGNLTFIEGDRHVPFPIKRSFWIYDVPGGEMRGGHAYRRNCEVIIAMSGSLEVEIDDASTTSRFLLNRSYYALYVPRLHWRSLVNFSTNSVCLVLASQEYDEADYLYDYVAYQQLRGK